MHDTPKHNSEPNATTSEESTGGPQHSHSRRAFLKGLTAAGVTAPVVAIATSAAARSKARGADVLSGTHSNVLNLKNRRDQAFNTRLNAAADDHAVKVPPHPNNGDETAYPSG